MFTRFRALRFSETDVASLYFSCMLATFILLYSNRDRLSLQQKWVPGLSPGE
jgi:hypothetical protein